MESDPGNKQNLLILDMDETLVHTTEDVPLPRGADFTVLDSLHVHLRPGLARFFSRVSPTYKIGFWSAGGHDYVHAVLARIVPASLTPEFIWTSNRCTRRRDDNKGDSYVIKDLNKLRRKGYDLSRTLIADDDVRTASRNFGNLVSVQPFEGDPDDDELESLGDYLLSIQNIGNFRTLEKRGWRARITAKQQGK